MKAPFPWFGGKSRCASLVWERFGDVPNYIEPFAGSLAVLLGRPTEPRIETVNDKDAFISNFWRAVQADPEAVAHHADWPVSEVDLHARHLYLVNDGAKRVQRLLRDPDYFDARVAGWWVWGLSCWIGGDWCSGKGPLKPLVDGAEDAEAAGVYYKHPQLDACKGVNCKTPALGNGGRGVNRQMPWLSSLGQGVNAKAFQGTQEAAGVKQSLPMLRHHGAGANAKARQDVPGVVMQRPHLNGKGQGVKRCMPHTADGGRGIHAQQRSDLTGYMLELAERLRRVRVCCGDWSRVCTSGPTTCNGLTAVFLDPPYAIETGRDKGLYNEDALGLSAEVRAWAIANGDNPLLRIALCGYEGEHTLPGSWDCVSWKAHGGYGTRKAGGRGNQNSKRERIWFSPHCLPVPVTAHNLFGEPIT